MIDSIREIDGKIERETRFYVTSLNHCVFELA